MKYIYIYYVLIKITNANFYGTKICIINPRRACAERVTVVVSCVCVCVCLYVCPNTLFWQYAQLEV